MRLLLMFFLFSICSCSSENECSEGFTGSDCLEEIIPRIITIESVELSEVPEFRPDGTMWDIAPNNLADPLIEINDFGFSNFISELGPKEKATYEGSEFNFNGDDTVTIAIYDFDGLDQDTLANAAELIANYTFPVYLEGESFPDFIEFGVQPKLKLAVKYEF